MKGWEKTSPRKIPRALLSFLCFLSLPHSIFVFHNFSWHTTKFDKHSPGPPLASGMPGLSLSRLRLEQTSEKIPVPSRPCLGISRLASPDLRAALAQMTEPKSRDQQDLSHLPPLVGLRYGLTYFVWGWKRTMCAFVRFHLYARHAQSLRLEIHLRGSDYQLQLPLHFISDQFWGFDN